jgi:hypothetical protein
VASGSSRRRIKAGRHQQSSASSSQVPCWQNPTFPRTTFRCHILRVIIPNVSALVRFDVAKGLARHFDFVAHALSILFRGGGGAEQPADSPAFSPDFGPRVALTEHPTSGRTFLMAVSCFAFFAASTSNLLCFSLRDFLCFIWGTQSCGANRPARKFRRPHHLVPFTTLGPLQPSGPF